MADYYKSDARRAKKNPRITVVSHSEDPYPMTRLLRDSSAMPLSFCERPTETVAHDLLGCVLRHQDTAGMIVETEAYLGGDDLAAHSARGRTERTRVIFGPPGHAYVYFIYGMHECLNVVTDREGTPGCVLIRALAPLSGLPQMYARRQWNGPEYGLANGPGKLTEALAITRAQYGLPLDGDQFGLRLWRQKPQFEVEITPRIGITKCVDWPLRFVWANHPCVSKQSRGV